MKRKEVGGGYSTWQISLVSSDGEDKSSRATEAVQYFNTPRSKTDGLEFWNENKYHFSFLSAMARDFLAVQASSVPSERAFSAGGNLVSENGAL
jgi:ethanolamine utilization protein EutP (predicted NTPase)